MESRNLCVGSSSFLYQTSNFLSSSSIECFSDCSILTSWPEAVCSRPLGMHPRIRASSAAGELCHAWSWLWCRLVLQRPVPVLPVPGSQESARNGVAQPGQKLSSKWTSASQSTSPAPPDAAGPFQSFAPPSSLTAARLGRVWSPPRRLSFWFLFRRPLSSLATSRRRPTHAPPARCRSSRKRRHAHCRPAWTKPADSRDERRQPVRSDRDRHASSDQQQQRQPACQRISVGVTDSPGLPCLPCFSSVPLSSVFPLRGVLPPSSVAPSLVSSLPSQAAHLASLAWVPPSELEVRKHTDHFRPLIEKEHSTVYWDKKGQSVDRGGTPALRFLPHASAGSARCSSAIAGSSVCVSGARPATSFVPTFASCMSRTIRPLIGR